MENWVPIWKVLDLDGRASCIMMDPRFRVVYPPRQVVYPPVGYLFGFDSHEAAQRWASQKCFVVPAAATLAAVPVARVLDYLSCEEEGAVERFWLDGTACSLVTLPPGTVACTAICCWE